MEIAEKAIEATADFLFNKIGLDDTFTKVGIKEEDFEIMAQKACRKGKEEEVCCVMRQHRNSWKLRRVLQCG